MVNVALKDLKENSVIELNGDRKYVIDQMENESIIQSMDGSITETLDNTTIVNLIAPLTRGFDYVSEETIEKMKLKYESDSLFLISFEAKLPIRGTSKSAGYDISTPIAFDLKPGEKKVIWTNIKAYMQDNEVLIANVRSSMGIKNDLMIANTLGIIDSDYFNNEENEGNIGIALRNIGNFEIEIVAGEKIAQLIFIPYLVADNCNTTKQRKGGLGSTGR